MSFADTGGPSLDPRYVAARRVLLDALTALKLHGDAIIVVGAQAIYLHTRLNEIGIAPFTIDGDLALDPSLLGDEPELETTMRGAGFALMPQAESQTQPGIWAATVDVGNGPLIVPIDLIVPEAATTGGGRRGARLGVHGNRAARRATGLEAALVDHSPMTVRALDSADARSVVVEVAGLPAMIVAKAHKLHDRIQSGRVDRLSDKDASDMYRIMQSMPATEAGLVLKRLLGTKSPARQRAPP